MCASSFVFCFAVFSVYGGVNAPEPAALPVVQVPITTDLSIRVAQHQREGLGPRNCLGLKRRKSTEPGRRTRRRTQSVGRSLFSFCFFSLFFFSLAFMAGSTGKKQPAMKLVVLFNETVITRV